MTEVEDRCGFCGQTGTDKVPHPVRWPGEEAPGTPFVHAAFHGAAMTDPSEAREGHQEKETLREEIRGLLERLRSARPLSIGSIDTHRDARYATADIARLAALLDPVEGT